MKHLKTLLLFLVLAVSTAQALTISGLNWDKANGATNSNVWMYWSGANILPRTIHTAIWRYNPRQQTGYYTVAWHASTNPFWGASTYEFGTHPWPAADCTVDGNGQGQTGTTGSGTAHCWELAGLGASDFLSTPGGGPGMVVDKDLWKIQARQVKLASSGPCNGQYEHRVYPDLGGSPSLYIRQCVASIDSPSTAGQFLFGASPWTASGNNNTETLSGYLRGIQLYADWLDPSTDLLTEAANHTNNTPQTAAGIASVWYMNQNPIPSDVTDKSGAGHSPSWTGAQRPAQWDSTYTTSFSGKGQLLGVGRP